MIEPCMCGALDCRDCYPSTAWQYIDECEECENIIIECTCNGPEPRERISLLTEPGLRLKPEPSYPKRGEDDDEEERPYYDKDQPF